MPTGEVDEEIIREWLKTRGAALENRIALAVQTGNKPLLDQVTKTNQLLLQLLGKPTAPAAVMISPSTPPGVPAENSFPYPSSYLSSFFTTIQKAGTLQQLYRTSLPSRFATVLAAVTNTGNILLGGPLTDNTNGFPLTPGQSIDIYIDDLSKVWIYDVVAGDIVRVLYEVGQGST